MKIVKATGSLKGRHVEQHYTGCDLIVGPNGSGKTTSGPLIVTAALEGLASTPTDSRRPYIGEPEGGVKLELSDGSELARDLSWHQNCKAAREADASARALVGVPPTAWDLRDFSRGTDGERGSIVDAVARAGGALDRWTVSAAMIRTQEICAEREGVPLTAYELLAEYLPDAVGAVEWVAAALPWAESHQSRTRAAHEQAKSVLVRCEERASDVDAPDGDVDQLRQELEQLREQQARGTDRQRQLDQLRRHEQEGERLAATMERLRVAGQALREPTASQVDHLQAEVARLRAELDAPMTSGVTASQIEEAEGRERHQIDRLRDAESARREAWDASRSADAAERGAAQALADARAAVPAPVSTPCRHCGGVDPLGQASGRPDALARVEDCEARLTSAAECARDARARAETADRRCETLTRARDRAMRELRDLRAQYVDPQARDRVLRRAEGELAREQARVTAAEARRVRDLEATRREYAQARDAYREWERTPAPEVAEVVDVSADIARVRGQITAHETHARLLEDLREAGSAALRAGDDYASARALVAALRQVRDEIASAAYRPIDEAARSLLDGAEGLPVPYFDGPSDYGAVTRHGRVPYAGLSESEQRITAAALVYAMAVVRGQPVRLVLLDGLEVVQRDHRAPLMAALARAVERGDVDNVIATCIERIDAPGVRVWELA